MVIKRKLVILFMLLTIITLFFKTVYDLYGLDGVVILTGLTYTAVIIKLLSE